MLLQCVLVREQVGHANIMSQMEISTAPSYYLHSFVTLQNQPYLEFKSKQWEFAS